MLRLAAGSTGGHVLLMTSSDWVKNSGLFFFFFPLSIHGMGITGYPYVDKGISANNFFIQWVIVQYALIYFMQVLSLIWPFGAFYGSFSISGRARRLLLPPS